MGKSLLLSLLLMLAGVTVLVADDGAALRGEESAALAARLMAVARVIEREHFDPPPRQEVVHRLMKRLAARSHTPLPPGLGRELSSLTDEAELEALLAHHCRAVVRDESADTESLAEWAEQLVIHDLLESLPGANFVRSRKEHVVADQFASNRYVGTGIALSVGDRRIPLMHKVFENGPAAKAGARQHDLILEIDGQSTEGMRIEDVVDRLRGPAGSAVTVRLRQPDEDEVRELTITRGVVPLKHTTLERDGGTHVIKMSRITAATVEELREVEAQIGDASGEIVLEVPESTESLGGSDLHQAVMLADALLDGGQIGRAVTAAGVREFAASRDCLFRDRPLKVRVTQNTSGPIEWVVAALQDHGRATVVGQRTAGEPFVTQAYEVPGTEWVLELTYGVLERADGRPLLRTEPPPPSRRPHAVMMRTADGRSIPVGGPQVDDEHDGGVVPDELIEPAPRLRGRPAAQPPTDAATSLWGWLFGERTKSE